MVLWEDAAFKKCKFYFQVLFAIKKKKFVDYFF